MSQLPDFLTKLDPKKAIVPFLLLLAGALLNKFVPFAWHAVVTAFTWIGRRVGGRFAFRYFERTYLDWLVTQLRELKLTGIVTTDAAKKPRLEQVFVSLRMGGERDGISFMECAIAVCNEIKRNPSKRRRLVAALKRDLERASLEQRKEAEEYIERSIKEGKIAKKLTTSIASSAMPLLGYLSSLGRFTRSGFVRMSVDLFSDGDVNESEYLSTLFNQTLRDNQRLAVLGSPGSGKSTLLQYIGLAYAKARAGDPKLRKKNSHRDLLGAIGWKLPIFIPLSIVSKALAEPLPNGNCRTILDVLPSILPPDLQNDPAATNFFKKKITGGQCMILFDGLDEVPTDEEFKAVVNAIEGFTLAHPKNKSILTSRIAGWRGGVHADFKVFYLADLSEPQIDAFVTIWCEAVEQNAVVGRLEDEGQADMANRRRRAQQHAHQLRTTIRSNRGMRQLASNPMLLSIIALVHNSLPDLPKERTKLYSECSKILLEQWDMLKGRHVDDTRLRLEQKEAILRRIAFALHSGEIGKKGGSREAGRQEVEKLLSSLLPTFNMSSRDAERLLTRLIERSGIIVERQRDVLAFSHLTFQEYFVASHLAKSKPAGFLFLDGRIFTDWWREVAVMFAGLLEDSSDFLKSLHTNSHSDLFSTKLLLAGICLGESQVVRQVPVRESISADLAQLHSLGCLNGPASDFRELSGYLADWSRSDLARRHAVAFAIVSAADEGKRQAHLKQLAATIRDGDSEDVRLCVGALQLLPNLSIFGLAEAISEQVGKRDSRISANCMRLLSRTLPENYAGSVEDAFGTALGDSDQNVRTAAIDALLANSANTSLILKFQPQLEKLLSAESWRVRQSAAKTYSHFIRLDVAGCSGRLLDLIDKEDDADVLQTAFDSLREPNGMARSDEILEKLTKLLHAKNETVRALALDSVTYLLNDPERQPEILGTIREFIGARSDAIQDVLTKAMTRLSNERCIEIAVRWLLQSARTGSKTEKANSLYLLGTIRQHLVRIDDIDEALVNGLKSRSGHIRVGAARGIAQSDAWVCDDESYKVLVSMAASRSHSAQLCGLRAVGRTITPSRADETLEIIRRGLSSDDPRIRVAAAKAVSRLGKAGGTLKDLLMDRISKGQLFEASMFARGPGTRGQIRSFFMAPGDYASEAEAQEAIRDALLSIVTSKSDVQGLIDDISKTIDGSNRPHLGLIPLVQVIGALAEKHSSIKALECLLRILRLVEEGLEDVDFSADFVFFSPPFVMTLDDDAAVQRDIAAVGKKLQGRDVLKILRRALESQGILSKITILRALPEFESGVRIDLIPTIKDIANNDAPRVRDVAWESLKRINSSRGSWVISEPPAFDDDFRVSPESGPM